MSAPFITFEGGEGAGKSTQLERLTARLEAAGHRVHRTREPGGTAAADAIRALLVTGAVGRWDAIGETMLHVAARRDHVERRIRPARDAGAWVLCDRFADSTVAYQGFGHRVGRDLVDALHARAIGDLKPDLTLVLDLPPEEGLRRARRRAHPDPSGAAEDRYERMDGGFHARMRDGFLAIAAAEPERCVVVDAAPGAEEVAGRVADAVRRRFPEAGW